MLCNELLVENINHLQERSTLEDVLEIICLEMALRLRAGLTPYPYFDINILIHNA